MPGWLDDLNAEAPAPRVNAGPSGAISPLVGSPGSMSLNGTLAVFSGNL